MRLELDLAHLRESQRYAVLEQLWLWGHVLVVGGAVLMGMALWQLVQ